jgi:hypothetical protein
MANFRLMKMTGGIVGEKGASFVLCGDAKGVLVFTGPISKVRADAKKAIEFNGVGSYVLVQVIDQAIREEVTATTWLPTVRKPRKAKAAVKKVDTDPPAEE